MVLKDVFKQDNRCFRVIGWRGILQTDAVYFIGKARFVSHTEPRTFISWAILQLAPFDWTALLFPCAASVRMSVRVLVWKLGCRA
jgi:hypothetical protein